MKTKLGMLGLIAVTSLLMCVGSVYAASTLHGYINDMGTDLRLAPWVDSYQAAAGYISVAAGEHLMQYRSTNQNWNQVLGIGCCTDGESVYRFDRVSGNSNLYSVSVSTYEYSPYAEVLLQYSLDDINWVTLATDGVGGPDWSAYRLRGTFDVGSASTVYVRVIIVRSPLLDSGGDVWTLDVLWSVRGPSAVEAGLAALTATVNTQGSTLSNLESDFDNHVHDKGSGGRMTSGPIVVP